MIAWLDLDGTGHRALAGNIAMAMLAAAAPLGLAPALGWGRPPSAPIGAAWLLLFAAMGAARWNLTRAAEAEWLVHPLQGLQAWQARRWLGGLMLACLIDPLATATPGLGLAYHLLLLMLAICVVSRISAMRPASALLVAPVMLWTAIGALTLAELAFMPP